MVSTNNVVTVVNALVRTLKDQHAARKAALERAKVNLPIKLLIPLFKDVVGKVAPQALHRMLDIQDKQLSTGVATAFPPCTNTMKDSMGLPCVHVIDTYFRVNTGSLQVTNFHLQWHLNRLPPFLRLTHAYRYENPTLSSLEAGPLVLPHVALALLVVNLPDSRMKRQAANRLV